MLKKLNQVVVGSLALVAFVASMAGCSSGAMKARKAERDKLASQGKIYCDFVNGELFPDLEIELNLEMAKRCDQDKSISISNYKTPSENVGIMYCCVSQGDKRDKAEPKPEVRSEEKPKKDLEPKAPPVSGKAKDSKEGKDIDGAN